MARDKRLVEFAGGVRAQLPLQIGVAPFGLAFGAYAAKSGLPGELAQSMSAIIFGGASQFVAARLFSESVPGTVAVLTVLLLNARHMLYSASIAPYAAHLSRRWRWLLAYLLTDEAYATGIVRYARPDESPHKHWYLFGSALTLWIAWQIATAIGIAVGAAVPDAWSLDFALPLTFIAILVPSLRGRADAVAAIVAAVLGVIAFRWPNGTGLLSAVVAGMATGMVMSRRFAGRRSAIGGSG